MANIRKYIEDHLLSPLKQYPTVIQATILELIIEKLETLYNYTLIFPEIVSPNMDRLDILKTITEQFLFTIRDDADLEEQINILDNVLTIYSKRGSIDTIENMWKYYGGDLPKEVKVVIPAHSIFKYNVSQFSSSQVFQDGTTYRNGVYEIQLTNNTYPIPELKKFMLDELVAAGNYIYFSNIIRLDTTTETKYKYDVLEELLLNLEIPVAHSYQGLYLSGPKSVALSGQFSDILYRYQILTDEQRASDEYKDIVDMYNLMNTPAIDGLWSGKENIYVDICEMIESMIDDYYYIVNSKDSFLWFNIPVDASASYSYPHISLVLQSILYCTPSSETVYIERDLYNDKEEHVIEREYFLLGDSLLGEFLGYELASEEII